METFIPSGHSKEIDTSSSPSDPFVTTNAVRSWRRAGCKALFPQSKLLEKHARQTRHKAYRCAKDTTCRKVFSKRTAAIRHESLHSAKSQSCSKVFHRLDHRQEHEDICDNPLVQDRLSPDTVRSSRQSPTLAVPSPSQPWPSSDSLYNRPVHSLAPSFNPLSTGYKVSPPLETSPSDAGTGVDRLFQDAHAPIDRSSRLHSENRVGS
jgi:hypothetical protein